MMILSKTKPESSRGKPKDFGHGCRDRLGPTIDNFPARGGGSLDQIFFWRCSAVRFWNGGGGDV